MNDSATAANTTNLYGSAARDLITFACTRPDDTSFAELAASLKLLSVSLVQYWEDKGVYAKGATDRYKLSRYTISPDCKNEALRKAVS
jgi:hypothetical protein